MKNRSWILLLMSLFLVCPLFADEEPIDMDEEPSTDRWNRGNRSIDYRPLVSHDGDILYIYSEVPLVGLRVMLKDMNGMIVYSNVASIASKEKIALPLMIGSGSYIIELNESCSHNVLYGYMTINLYRS